MGILLLNTYVCCQCSMYQDTFWSLKLVEFECYFLQLMYHFSATYLIKVSPHFLNPGFVTELSVIKEGFSPL